MRHTALGDARPETLWAGNCLLPRLLEIFHDVLDLNTRVLHGEEYPKNLCGLAVTGVTRIRDQANYLDDFRYCWMRLSIQPVSPTELLALLR